MHPPRVARAAASHLLRPERMPSKAGFRLDPLRVSVALFIIISISTVHAYVGVLRVLRLGVVLWLACVGLVFLTPKKVRWANVTATWPPRAILAIVVIACLSAPAGLSVGASGKYLIDVYFRVVAFFLVLLVATKTVRDLYLFVWAFVASAAILGVLSFTVMQISAVSGGGARLDAQYMYDANDLGLIFLTAIPLGLMLFQVAGGYGRWLAAAATAVTAAAVALTGSRGAFVGMMVVVPALFFGLRQISIVKRVSMVVVLVGGLVVAAPEGYWERISTIFAPTEDYNVTETHGRMQIAKRGLGYMFLNPFLGVGIANFARAEVTISPMARNAMPGQAIPFLAPHNTYVQIGAELGLPALLIWLSILAGGSIGVWRLRRRLAARRLTGASGFEERFIFQMCTYLPIAFLGFASTSFFVSHAYTPVFYIMVTFLSGVLMFQGASGGAPSVSSATPSMARRRAGKGWPGRGSPIH